MIRRGVIFLMCLIIASCIEPYEFVIENNKPTLVIEAFISDKSFDETRGYPSDGRYFTVKLSYTSDVDNRRTEAATNAIVQLQSDRGEKWNYMELTPGIYVLFDNAFRASVQVKYKLVITTQDDINYESSWEQLPEIEQPEMGEVSFQETEIQRYVVESSENVLRTRKGITANVNVGKNDTGSPIYYRWTYTPMWIYTAPLSSVVSPGHKCWATDPYYLPNYELQADLAGGYRKDLFFMETVRNERLFEEFSVLITQYSMNEGYYNFWKELKEKNQGNMLIDVPPYNLQTNFKSSDPSERVSGYFGVVHEQARRWYFSIKDLSYTVVNTLKSDCLVDYGPPVIGEPSECEDCRAYSFGKTTTLKPSWWGR